MTDFNELDDALRLLLRPENRAVDEKFVLNVLSRIRRQRHRQSITISCLCLLMLTLLSQQALKLASAYAPLSVQWQNLSFSLSPGLVINTFIALAVGTLAVLIQRLFQYTD